jgi:hypothetical protein
MTCAALILLKLWLATAAIVLVWCFTRLADIRGAAIPGALVLALCGAIRGLI